MDTQTEQFIVHKLFDIEKALLSLRAEQIRYSIEEISLSRASKLLHLGQAKILSLVKSGKLKSRMYVVDHKKRYRFKLADITEFQDSRLVAKSKNFHPVTAGESAESIVERFFPRNRSQSR